MKCKNLYHGNEVMIQWLPFLFKYFFPQVVKKCRQSLKAAFICFYLDLYENIPSLQFYKLINYFYSKYIIIKLIEKNHKGHLRFYLSVLNNIFLK